MERWNAQISGGTPVAKAVLWTFPDAEKRKRGEQNRLRYPGSPRRKRWALGVGPFHGFRAVANALSAPPGEYGRKAKTQRN